MKTDNELIAEFMGWRIDNSFPDKNHIWRLGSRIETKNTLKFNESWDWLMPVVEKIMFFAYVKIDNGQCMISVNGTLVSGVVNGSNIENTYRAVVEFIRWHNTNNQTN